MNHWYDPPFLLPVILAVLVVSYALLKTPVGAS
jgi:hypothetical protein